jgi:hypothetical protein
MQPVLNETDDAPTAIPLEEPIFDIDNNGTNEFESNTSPEGVPPSRESDRDKEFNFPEGVSGQEEVTQPTEKINDSAPIDIVENSDKRRPRRNIGTYKDGPANIRKFPIKGESHDYSFVSNFDDQFLVPRNCTNIQTKYHSSQKITKSSLSECYLLQDTWITDENCLHNIYTNVILDSWESNQPTIAKVIDPRTLAARTLKSKYNKDNPSWDTATKGPFQAEFWQAMRTELNTLTTKGFDCWEIVRQTPEMNMLPSRWVFKIKRYPDGSVKKFKARFCAQGDRQKEGINFFKMWSPVVH